jgi:hypothetical protein
MDASYGWKVFFVVKCEMSDVRYQMNLAKRPNDPLGNRFVFGHWFVQPDLDKLGY